MTSAPLPATNQQAARREGGSGMSRKRVLIIDSDEGFVQGLASTAQQRGIEAMTTASSDEGLELARSTRPDLIVVNVELAPTNGWSVCTRLKRDEELKDIPVLLTSSTSSVDTFEKHKKLKTRADEYLLKPYETDDFLRVTDQLIGLPLESDFGDTDDEALLIEDESLSLGDYDHADLDSPIAVPDDEPFETFETFDSPLEANALDAPLEDDSFAALGDEIDPFSDQPLLESAGDESLDLGESPFSDPLPADTVDPLALLEGGEETLVTDDVLDGHLTGDPLDGDPLAADALGDATQDDLAAFEESFANLAAEAALDAPAPGDLAVTTDKFHSEQLGSLDQPSDGAPLDALAELPDDGGFVDDPLATSLEEPFAATSEDPLAAFGDDAFGEGAFEESEFGADAFGETDLSQSDFGETEFDGGEFDETRFSESPFGEQPQIDGEFQPAPETDGGQPQEVAFHEEEFQAEAFNDESFQAESFQSDAFQATSLDGSLGGSASAFLDDPSQVSQLEARIAALEAELEGYRSTESTRDQEIERLRNESIRKDREAQDLRDQLHERDRQLAELRDSESRLNLEVARARDEKLRRETAMRSLTAKAEQINTAAKRYERELTSVREELRAAQAHKERVAELEEAQKQSDAELSRLRELESTLTQERDDLTAKHQALSTDLEKARQEADGLRTDLEEARATGEKALAESMELRAKHESLEARFSRLRQVIADLDTES